MKKINIKNIFKCFITQGDKLIKIPFDLNYSILYTVELSKYWKTKHERKFFFPIISYLSFKSDPSDRKGGCKSFWEAFENKLNLELLIL